MRSKIRPKPRAHPSTARPSRITVEEARDFLPPKATRVVRSGRSPVTLVKTRRRSGT
mgnify:CR=1 FL=1